MFLWKQLLPGEYFRQRDEFRWYTKELGSLGINQMTTELCFSAAKMLYNHLAEVFNFEVIDYGNDLTDAYLDVARRSPNLLIQKLMILVSVIEARNDLAVRYRSEFAQLRENWYALREPVRTRLADDSADAWVQAPTKPKKRTPPKPAVPAQSVNRRAIALDEDI